MTLRSISTNAAWIRRKVRPAGVVVSASKLRARNPTPRWTSLSIRVMSSLARRPGRSTSRTTRTSSRRRWSRQVVGSAWARHRRGDPPTRARSRRRSARRTGGRARTLPIPSLPTRLRVPPRMVRMRKTPGVEDLALRADSTSVLRPVRFVPRPFQLGFATRTAGYGCRSLRISWIFPRIPSLRRCCALALWIPFLPTALRISLRSLRMSKTPDL